MVSLLRDRYFHYENNNSELVLSDGNIESFRVTEYVLRKLKDYFGDILARYGRSFDDVEYIQYWDHYKYLTHVRLTVEQFLKFGEAYVWNSGPGYWSFKGKDFAITGYHCWYDTLNTFAWLSGKDYVDSGQPYKGDNEFLDSFQYVKWKGGHPKIEHAVITRANGENYRISAEAFMYPSSELYQIMIDSCAVAVMTECGWAVIGMGMGNPADITCFGDPKFIPLKEDAWGAFPSDSENCHSWLLEHTGKPTEEEIKNGIRNGIGQMISDGKDIPNRLFLYDCPDADCVFLFAEADEKDFDCNMCAAYLQPHFGEYVHVFPLQDFRKYFDFAKVIRCIYDSDRKVPYYTLEHYGRCEFEKTSDCHRFITSFLNPCTVTELYNAGITDVWVDPTELCQAAGSLYIPSSCFSQDHMPVFESLCDKILRDSGLDVIFAIIDGNTDTDCSKLVRILGGERPAPTPKEYWGWSEDTPGGCSFEPFGKGCYIKKGGRLYRFEYNDTIYVNMRRMLEEKLKKNRCSLADVKRFIRLSPELTEFSSEQFIKFSNRYGPDSEFGEWVLVAECFILWSRVVGGHMSVEIFRMESDVYVETDEVSSAEENLQYLGVSGLIGNSHITGVILDPGKGCHPLRITGHQFEHPSVSLHRVLNGCRVCITCDDRIILWSNDGSCIIPSDVPKAETDIWDFEGGSEHCHGWCATEKESACDMDEISERVKIAMETMSADGFSVPDRIFIYCDRASRSARLILDSNGEYDPRRCHRYIQPCFSGYVHVFTIQEYLECMRHDVLVCVFQREGERELALPPDFAISDNVRFNTVFNCNVFLDKCRNKHIFYDLERAGVTDVLYSPKITGPSYGMIYLSVEELDQDKIGNLDGVAHCADVFGGVECCGVAVFGPGMEIDEEGLFRM